jgi:hypothetical protein
MMKMMKCDIINISKKRKEIKIMKKFSIDYNATAIIEAETPEEAEIKFWDWANNSRMTYICIIDDIGEEPIND